MKQFLLIFFVFAVLFASAQDPVPVDSTSNDSTFVITAEDIMEFYVYCDSIERASRDHYTAVTSRSFVNKETGRPVNLEPPFYYSGTTVQNGNTTVSQVYTYEKADKSTEALVRFVAAKHGIVDPDSIVKLLIVYRPPD